jgi:AcrR family transcriptional regulator
MLMSALKLFRRHGYNGTGFREVISISGAPRGSIYHHFPAGKAQLGAETVTRAGELANEMFERALESEKDVVAGVERFWSNWVRFIEKTNFEEGCPVVGVAAEAHPEAPQLAEAATQAFVLWERTLTDSFRRAGVPRQHAQDLALLVITALEGATVLARAARDSRPLVRAGRQVARTLRAAIADET